MTAVFVKGFDFGTDEEPVRKHFEKVGTIKELYFQSRNSAVITYEGEDAAKRAVEELNETTMEGQKRYVNVKLDEHDGEGKGAGKGRSDAAPGRTVFVTGFDLDTDDDALTGHFSKCGTIEKHHFQAKWAAVVTYTDEAGAQEALKQEGTTISGQSHYVSVKMDDPDRTGSKGKGKGKSGKGEKGGKDSGKGSKGSGKDSGKGSGKKGAKDSGKSGGGAAIFVSGFDFETDHAALEWHFGKMGAIEKLHFQGKGSAVITYVKASAAKRAETTLHETTMYGQSRYVAVKMDDPDRGDSKGKGKGKGKGKSW